MASLTILDLPERTLDSLKSRADVNRGSMDGEKLYTLDYVVPGRSEFGIIRENRIAKQKEAFRAVFASGRIPVPPRRSSRRSRGCAFRRTKGRAVILLDTNIIILIMQFSRLRDGSFWIGRLDWKFQGESVGLASCRAAGSAANEKGVILTGTITGATKAKALEKDPFKPVEDGGVGEPNLPDCMIGNAATAREAVTLLGASVAEYGHAGAEIYMVADTNEAWYVEVYTGHHWAAVKMPADKVAVFGNHFNLRGFDTNDTGNVMFSPGLVAHAVTNGFAVWADVAQTKLDLYKTYADPDSVETNYANYRAWYGHRRFADKDLPEYRMDLLPELFFEPGYKLAPTNMFELMRTRYEDMTDEELPTPRTNAAIRVIGTVKQGNCHVLQLDCRENTPDNMRGTVWSCLGNCEHGVFHPINASQDYLPAAYTNDAQRTFGYDPNRAADAFRRLSALAQSNRKWYGPGVRAYWRAREVQMAEEWPRNLSAAIASGIYTALWGYTRDEENKSFAAAKKLYDELIWYAVANNRITGDGSGATDEPLEPFKPSDGITSGRDLR